MATQTLKASLLTLGLAAGLGTGHLIDRPSPALATVAAPQTTAAAPGRTMVRTELYFGTEKPGPDVTENQFRSFVSGAITPRFPDGLTVHTAYGQFKNSAGHIVKERSYVVVLFYPVTDAAPANTKVEQIRRAYLARFDQESVLRADSTDRVSF